MVDYIIVGCGLAGISFAEMALSHQKRVVVFDNNSQNSSTVAGGLYNPVILKRFSEVWNAAEQLEEMELFYTALTQKIKVEVDHKMPIYRKFFSVEEQNNWFAASDKQKLTPFLSTALHFTNFNGIDAPFGYGEVLQTGYVDTALLLNLYRGYLKSLKVFFEVPFDYTGLIFNSEGMEYKGIQAKHIVFAEGFGLQQNPFFNFLPLDGTKGELFVIKAPLLSIDVIVNTSIFILPLGNDLFKVGATYNWSDKTNLPTQEGKEELIDRIKEIINCDFEIVKHFAGVRPTVRDRRPLVGTHDKFSNVHVLNGLGTRGVMLGPAMAKALFFHIENDLPLPSEVNWRRFVKKLQR
ncbi:MAG: NAD(P)/FAD-dependent oxidoreductase [Flavobacterium sp.]